MEVRYGRLHNASLAVIATGMVVVTLSYFVAKPETAPPINLNDPRFVVYLSFAVVIGFFAWQGAQRFANRAPQVTIDHDGILLGFGRNKRFAWDQIQWVQLRRLGLRRQLAFGLEPDAFLAADLRLSQWNVDDGLRPVRGIPASVMVRDNGLDVTSAGMLAAIKSFRPNLVKS